MEVTLTPANTCPNQCPVKPCVEPCVKLSKKIPITPPSCLALLATRDQGPPTHACICAACPLVIKHIVFATKHARLNTKYPHPNTRLRAHAMLHARLLAHVRCSSLRC